MSFLIKQDTCEYIHADVNMNVGGAAKVKCKGKSTEFRHHQLLSCLFSRTLYEYSCLMFMFYYTVCYFTCIFYAVVKPVLNWANVSSVREPSWKYSAKLVGS